METRSTPKPSKNFAKSFNLPITILRPFNTFGPRQSFRAVIPSIIHQFINFNGVIKAGELASTRDFTFVEDLVRCFYMSSLSNNNIGKILNVGSGFEISISHLIDMVAEISGNKKFKIKIDKNKIRPKKSEVFRLLCDNRKIKELVGWQPSYNNIKSFKIPLSKTYDWIKNNDLNLNQLDHI